MKISHVPQSVLRPKPNFTAFRLSVSALTRVAAAACVNDIAFTCMRSTSLLIVLLALTGCAASQEQGPYGPAENIPSNLRMVNDELGKMELTLLEGIPTLVGPQR